MQLQVAVHDSCVELAVGVYIIIMALVPVVYIYVLILKREAI